MANPLLITSGTFAPFTREVGEIMEYAEIWELIT